MNYIGKQPLYAMRIKTNSLSYKSFALTVLILLCSVASSVICLMGDNPDYWLLFLLPSSFGVISLLFSKLVIKKILDNIGVLIIVVQLFIRNVLSPAFLVIGNYVTFLSDKNAQTITGAIILLLYETIATFITIALFSKHKVIAGLATRKTREKKMSSKTFGSILTVLCIYCILVWILIPEVRSIFRSATDILRSGIKEMNYSTSDVFVAGSLARIASTIFAFLFGILRFVVPASIIIWLNKKRKTKTHFYLSAIICFTQFIFIGNAIAVSMFAFLMLMLLLRELYPMYKRSINVFITVMVVLAVSILSFSYAVAVKYNQINNIREYISKWVNSYFTGVDNIAAAFLIPEKNKLQILFQTVFASLPFRSTWLSSSLKWDTMSSLYTGISATGNAGQIVATIASGCYLLTPVFAPLFSILFTYIALKYGVKYGATTNHWKKIAYLYMCVESALALGMYNIDITLVNLVQTGFPLLIIASFAGGDSDNEDIVVNEMGR